MKRTSLGSFVRQRRRELGLMQKSVAESCGVTPEMISQLESGRRHVSLRAIPKLADVLDVPAKRLFELLVKDMAPGAWVMLLGESENVTIR